MKQRRMSKGKEGNCPSAYALLVGFNIWPCLFYGAVHEDAANETVAPLGLVEPLERVDHDTTWLR